jgi:hypothetical protein
MKSSVAFLLCVIAGALLCGCEAPQQAAPAQMVARPSADLAAMFPAANGVRAPVDPHPDAVPAHLNSPRAAAQEIVTRGRPIDRQSERTVRLHAAMYRAAINADQASHGAYLLVPAAGDAGERSPAMSERAFRLRVLSALMQLSMLVKWDGADMAWMLDERTPGGPAARAWFEIVRTNDELATVEADVCIESTSKGTRKYRVEAIYDGERWTVRDLGARTIW